VLTPTNAPNNFVSQSSGSSASQNSLSGGAIAGIVVGALAGVALLSGLSYYFYFVYQSTPSLVVKSQGSAQRYVFNDDSAL